MLDARTPGLSTPAAPVSRLAHVTVRAGAWTISAGLVTRFLSVVGALTVTYFIAPYDYGEVIAASLIVLTANQLSTLSVGTYILAHRAEGRQILFSAAALHVGLGLVALPAVLLFGARLGVALKAPTVGRYLPGLVLACLLERVTYVPERVLMREMKFGGLSIIRSTAELAYTMTSIVTAMLGWGGMAIVAGGLVRSGLRLTMIMSALGPRSTWGPMRIQKSVLRGMVRFGLPVSIGALATFSMRRWDNLAVSRFFGPAVMGAYSLAYNIAEIPAAQVGEQVSEVLQAAFSRARAQNSARTDALLRSTATLSLIMAPLAVGLACVAPTLTSLLSHKWSGVTSMLMLLAAMSFVRPTADTIAGYLQIRRHERLVALGDMTTVVLMMGGLWTLGRTSPDWACAVVGMAFGARLMIAIGIMYALEGTPPLALLGPLLRPALACIPMAAAVYGVRVGLPGFVHVPIRLAAEVLTGVAVYAVSALVLARGQARDLIGLVKGSLRRRMATAV
jgi:PST family polysaccharide transporter